MKQNIRRIITTSLVLALVATPGLAFANEDGDGTTTNESGSTTTTTTEEHTSTSADRKDVAEKRAEALKALRERLAEQKAERQEKFDSKREALQERLEGAKKKACEKHQTTINRIITKMNKGHETSFDRITRISEAIQKFYTEKELSIANYDDLVAAINAAKGVAQTNTEEQVAVPELDCDSDHPRADVTDFRQKRLDSVDSVKAYRDAVKALGQAVRTVVKNTEGES